MKVVSLRLTVMEALPIQCIHGRKISDDQGSTLGVQICYNLSSIYESLIRPKIMQLKVGIGVWKPAG